MPSWSVLLMYLHALSTAFLGCSVMHALMLHPSPAMAEAMPVFQ